MDKCDVKMGFFLNLWKWAFSSIFSPFVFTKIRQGFQDVFAQPKHFFGDILKDLQLSKFWHFPFFSFVKMFLVLPPAD